MADVLYVHGFTENTQIRRELFTFYSNLLNANINGLMLMHPVLAKETLDGLLRGQSSEFQGRVTGYFDDMFSGIGIWTEWSSTNFIDEFYQSQMHVDFFRFAQGTLDKAWYLVIQKRGDAVISREVKKPL
ncbi:hypothetical protein HYX06_01845 [Candidatus Woesearchaeota archaeon]|nr:hypothetical protein [Candidatus Woesearchaeota archaeon]